MSNPLEELRKVAEGYDLPLLIMMNGRAHFGMDIDFYRDKESNAEFLRDDCLFRSMNEFYLPILLAIQKDGRRDVQKVRFDKSVFYNQDLPLFWKLTERTTRVGYDVAMYKGPRGLPTYVKSVEERKIIARIAQSRRRGMILTPNQIRNAFNLVFAETRRIEDIVETENKDSMTGQGVHSFETFYEGAVPIIEEQARLIAERLKKRDGTNHPVHTFVTHTSGGCIRAKTVVF